MFVTRQCNIFKLASDQDYGIFVPRQWDNVDYFAVRLPLFADLDKPAELGLQGAYSFKVRSTDDLRIGAWYALLCGMYVTRHHKTSCIQYDNEAKTVVQSYTGENLLITKW